MNKFVNVCSNIAGAISFCGIILAFPHAWNIVLLCGIVSLINSFIQIIFGEQNSIITEAVTIVIALIISVVFDISWLIVVPLTLCIVDFIITILGWIQMAYFARKI